MRADRERVEVIGFQCDNSRTGYRRIILRVNQRIVNLNTGEFAEITVCTESKRFVTVLRLSAVCTFNNLIIGEHNGLYLITDNESLGRQGRIHDDRVADNNIVDLQRCLRPEYIAFLS